LWIFSQQISGTPKTEGKKSLRETSVRLQNHNQFVKRVIAFASHCHWKNTYTLNTWEIFIILYNCIQVFFIISIQIFQKSVLYHLLLILYNFLLNNDISLFLLVLFCVLYLVFSLKNNFYFISNQFLFIYYRVISQLMHFSHQNSSNFLWLFVAMRNLIHFYSSFWTLMLKITQKTI